MNTSPRLSIQDLKYTYRDYTKEQDKREYLLFDNFNLSLDVSQNIAIAGRSGVGKSTLLQLIARLQILQGGTITLGGSSSFTTSYLTQEDSLYPWFTVVSNIALPMKIKGHTKRQAEDRARELLRDFSLEHLQNDYPSQLSGGMKQRISLLRACAQESDIVLLDEPFSHLDAITSQECRNWFMRLVEKTHLRVLMVTHNLIEATDIASRIVFLHDMPVRSTIRDSRENIDELTSFI